MQKPRCILLVEADPNDEEFMSLKLTPSLARTQQ